MHTNLEDLITITHAKRHYMKSMYFQISKRCFQQLVTFGTRESTHIRSAVLAIWFLLQLTLLQLLYFLEQKPRPLLAQLRQTPGRYSRPGLY